MALVLLFPRQVCREPAGRDSCLLGCQTIEALDPSIPQTYAQIDAVIEANNVYRTPPPAAARSGAMQALMAALLMLSAIGLVLIVLRCIWDKGHHHQWSSASKTMVGEPMLENKPRTYSVATTSHYYPAVAVRVEPVLQSESDGDVTS